jgi:hypothetical protein
MTRAQIFHWVLVAGAAGCAIVTELFSTGLYSHSAAAASVLFVVSIVAREIAAKRDAANPPAVMGSKILGGK